MEFENLKKLIIYFHPSITSSDQVRRNKFAPCLDTDQIRERYQMKHFEGYL